MSIELIGEKAKGCRKPKDFILFLKNNDIKNGVYIQNAVDEKRDFHNSMVKVTIENNTFFIISKQYELDRKIFGAKKYGVDEWISKFNY